jgi:hypothetical protein
MAKKLSAETRAVRHALKLIISNARDCIGWEGQTKVDQALSLGKNALFTARKLGLPRTSEYDVATLFEALLYRSWIQRATLEKRQNDRANLSRT